MTADQSPRDSAEEMRRSLLERHNPLLALLPCAPGRSRPGAIRAPLAGRGDYHPCSAELFLDQVVQYDSRRAWRLWPEPKRPPTGRQALMEKVQNNIGSTSEWELDIAEISRSWIWGSAGKAWKLYQSLLLLPPKESKSVTYARYFDSATAGKAYEKKCSEDCLRPDGIVLQYFYLYLFNDAANKHEGDWEMASVELDRSSLLPLQVGYSGHQSGARRRWEGVTRKRERPVVFVARGSHAAYLVHMPGGHHTGRIDWSKNLGVLDAPARAAQTLISNAFFFFGVRDFTCPVVDSGDGVQFEPDLPEPRMLPDTAPGPSDRAWDDFWWMNLDCRWGSSRSRVREFVGPFPAWRQQSKWDHPLCWLRHLPER